jgi:hypothetical protein
MLALSLVFPSYPIIGGETKAAVQVEPPEFDGDLILADVILKPNIPTTEEEIQQVNDYIAAEKKAAEAKLAQKKKAATKKVAAASVTSSGYKTNYKYLQCVEFAKQYLGHSLNTSWGNGGRKLSLNGQGDVGDVVIFKRIHVAVVIAREGNTRTIVEANYDNKGSIRTRTLNNSEVRGYHSF